jgi:hypothetical protein
MGKEDLEKHSSREADELRGARSLKVLVMAAKRGNGPNKASHPESELSM